ncbi:MAG: lytic transglycosylase domain-containing protein [Nocardioides sp.]|nr:lytic transglycosylase domain-containing protein [Nocardioides sp.]
MLLREKYVPKHRVVSKDAPRTAGRTPRVLAASVAVAVTGATVSAGVMGEDPTAGATSVTATSVAGAAEVADALAGRAQEAERPDRSAPRRDREKVEALAATPGDAVTGTDDLADADPKDVARQMMGEFGFAASEYGCLDQLWISESDWEFDAANPTSSAYGIPQALTGGTHDDLPADYMTNPVSQIRWGLNYIRDSYGTPCSAWSFKQANDWY